MSIISGNNITITSNDLISSYGNFIIRTPTTNSSDTLDNATNIQVANYGESTNNYNENYFRITIYNNSLFKITLNPGSGNTLLPESPILILPGVINEFMIIQTSAGTNSILLNGVGNASDVFNISLSNNSVIVGNNQNIATQVTMSGDATINNTGVLTLSNTSVSPGFYSNANITVDSKGRITSASNGSLINYFYAYGPTTSIDITTTTPYTTLTTYNTPQIDPSVYNYSSGVVTILSSGIYEISYTIQFNSNGNSGTAIGVFQSRILLNGSTEVPGSVTECSLNRIAGTNNRAFCSKSWIISANANDTVAIQWAEQLTTTVAQVSQNKCIFTVKKLTSTNSFYAYGPTTSIDITTTTPYTTLTTYNSPSFNSSVYNYSSGIVTILSSGIYEISYTIQFNSNGNSGTAIGVFQSRILLNGSTEVPGSVTECILNRIAGTNNRAFCSKSWIISANANDTVAIQWAEQLTTTVAQVSQNKCIFTVKKL